MKSKFIAAAVSVAGLVLPASAMAQQISTQSAIVDQTVTSAATANPTVANVNVPAVTGSGGNASTGDNMAAQNVHNTAVSAAANTADVGQNSTQLADPSGQSGGHSGYGQESGKSGTGGSPQFSRQFAAVGQKATSAAVANPHAVNINAPQVSSDGGYGQKKDSGYGQKKDSGYDTPSSSTGPNVAAQGVTNTAVSAAANRGAVGQNSTQLADPSGQSGGHSGYGQKSGKSGTGGSPQFSGQFAAVGQKATSAAVANPIAINTNLPIVLAIGGKASTGDNTAAQNVHNTAASAAPNTAILGQGNTQRRS